MPLVNNSQDLLYIAIALSVLGLTFFICWAIYYLIMIFRQSSQVVKEMRDRLHKIDGVIDTLKDKIEHSASYLLLIGEGIKKLVEIIKERGEKKAKTNRKSKKEVS